MERLFCLGPTKIAVLAIGNGLGLLIHYTHWVKIDYLDAKGQVASKYFAEKGLGWSGLLGGTTRLLEELKRKDI